MDEREDVVPQAAAFFGNPEAVCQEPVACSAFRIFQRLPHGHPRNHRYMGADRCFAARFPALPSVGRPERGVVRSRQLGRPAAVGTSGLGRGRPAGPHGHGGTRGIRS